MIKGIGLKKVTSLLLALVLFMGLALTFGTVNVAAAGDTKTAGMGGDFEDAAAVSSWAQTLSGTGNVLTIVGDMDFNTQIIVANGVDLTVRSDGTTRTLTRSNGYVGSFFWVEGNLTLENIVLDGNKSAVSAHYPFVYVESTGSFTMNAGTVLQNNSNNDGACGGGVIAKGTFTMNGGSIINNDADGGGGVYIDANASFYMNNGTISDNMATNTSGRNYGGGGVLAGDATFDISGGTITGNIAPANMGAGIRAFAYSQGTALSLSGNPQIGTSDTDNGIYIDASLHITITDDFTSGACVNIEGIVNAATDSLVAIRTGGDASLQEAEYFHYLPGGFSVIPSYAAAPQDNDSYRLLADYQFTVAFPTVTNNTIPVSGTINADYSNAFAGGNGSTVLVNGQELVQDVDYTHDEGSTIITLTSDYLQTLQNDVYNVVVNFANGGRATTTLTVAVPLDTSSAITANNKITLQGGDIVAGTKFSFTATGDRQNATGVTVGDERYIPKTWSVNPSGNFTLANGEYTGSTTINTPGSYIFTATFQLQTYDGTNWVATGTTDTQSMTVNIRSAPDPNPGNVPQTGDATNLLPYFLSNSIRNNECNPQIIIILRLPHQFAPLPSCSNFIRCFVIPMLKFM